MMSRVKFKKEEPRMTKEQQAGSFPWLIQGWEKAEQEVSVNLETFSRNSRRIMS